MSLEVELKLQLLTEHTLDQLAWFTAHHDCQYQSRSLVKNTYLDTHDLALVQAKIALRIREVEGQFYQTLKTKGSSVGGLHQRGEWEYAISDAQLDLSLLPEHCLPHELNKDDLSAVFNTDFVRNKWLWQDKAGNKIEVVHDFGEVHSGEAVDVINELELELLQGDPHVLFILAQAIAMDVPCVLSDVTKAQRGYELFAKGAWQLASYPWDAEDTMQQFEYVIHQLSSQRVITELTWQRLLQLLSSERIVDLWIRSTCLKGRMYLQQHDGIRGALLVALAQQAYRLAQSQADA